MATASDDYAVREGDLPAHRAGEVAAAGLRDALARVGITLPSLGADLPVCGSGRVNLGGCTAGTATALAEIVTAAADARPDLRASRP
ncbi:hypothetical protein [Streptomyces cacaoi]|uniref:hypothetical protein n=1 Tax=Streptomyces cacaoi TaxID=1898 RepID=UPI001FD4252B|nr:hypothetical protein [Streptomyces cacaoi]